MRKFIGVVCMILGVACLLGAVGFVFYNRWEDENAGKVSQSFLEEVQVAIEQEKINRPTENEVLDAAPNQPEETVPVDMATVKVDGYDCIGVLSVPVLGVELPVLTDWSYTKLKKAPCLYYALVSVLYRPLSPLLLSRRLSREGVA